jgi:hypothetical protein
MSEQQQQESNWDRCMRMAAEISKDELIRDLIMYIHTHRTRSERGMPLWSLIGDATSHGSGVSTAIMRTYWPEYKGD